MAPSTPTQQRLAPRVDSPGIDDRSLLGDRRRRRFLALGLIVAELVLLTAGAVVFRRKAIENQLERSVLDAVSIDHPGLKVNASGRDITITGVVKNAKERAAVAKIARRRPGVRTVDVSGVGGVTQLDPADTGTIPDGSPVPTTAPITGSTAVPAPVRSPQVSAVFTSTTVTVRGEVPNADAKTALLGRLLERGDDLKVLDELVVSSKPTERPDLAQYRRLGTFLDTLARLGAPRATVNFDRTILSLDAEVSTSADRDLLRRESVVLVGGSPDRVRGVISVTASLGATTATDSTIAGAATTTIAGDATTTIAGSSIAVPPIPSTPQAQAAQTAITAAIKDRTIGFAKSSISLSDEGRAVVSDVAAALKSSTAKIEVGGHTDWKGRAAINLELSRARAEAVRAALIAGGIDASRITAKGYGEDIPVASNDTDAGRAKNRRIEIRVVG